MKRIPGSAGRAVAAIVLVAAVTWFNATVIPPNSTTCALVLLLVILGVSTSWGYAPSLAASVAAAVGFGYVLPPPGSIRIDEPEDWLAFAVFVITALTASRLSESARLREQEAVGLRHVAERLMGTGEVTAQSVAGRIPPILAEVFHLDGAAFFFPESNDVYYAGTAFAAASQALLKSAEQARDAPHITRLPVQTTAGTGVLTLSGARLSREAREALPTIVALAIARARAADQAAEAQAHRKRDELRAALLAAVAHDFRTPLTVVKGAITELLGSSRSTEDAELLEIINEGADRMNRLLAEAIELGRIESSSLRLNRVPTGIAALITGVAAEFSNTGRVHAEAPLPAARLDIEPERIRQVLRQLIGNALKYSPPGTRVSLAASLRDTDAVLSVRDFGPGIPSAEIDHVFEPFFRGAGAASAPGTGMGLAISRALVEAHGGKIWVLSYAGQGSVFSFSIPLASRTAGEQV